MIETTGNRKMQIHTTDKPFNITKKQVYEAYKAVKSNAGSAGVDDHQHEAGRAEAALEGAMLDEGLLDRIEIAVLVEGFDGLDPGAVGEGGEIEAARHRAAVNDEGAATA
jgi:hypothetical protein